jgi:stage III sporulation protein AE
MTIVHNLPGNAKKTVNLVGTVAIAALLLRTTNSMIALGTDTIRELSDYGKLLLPVMTAAFAAQGGITGSAALYTGTAIFNALLGSLISSLLIPMIYLFLVLTAANSAVGEDILKKMADFVKWIMVWSLKILLYVFTGYIGITGVVSGTTDAATLKAAKITISGVVPVVGGILSDASEAVLVSAGVVKNAAGIYGIFAVLALCISPFLRIGSHYLLLKATGAFCEVFGTKESTGLISGFSGAMGLLLAMTGSVCLMLLISTVCFLKGVG